MSFSFSPEEFLRLYAMGSEMLVQVGPVYCVGTLVGESLLAFPMPFGGDHVGTTCRRVRTANITLRLTENHRDAWRFEGASESKSDNDSVRHHTCPLGMSSSDILMS